MKTTFEIHYKGQVAAVCHDLHANRNFNDFASGSGSIRFFGTDQQVDDYIDQLQKSSPGLKVIGVVDTRLTLAKIEIFQEEPINASIFKIEDSKDFDSMSKFGSATISQIVNLIDNAGTFTEIMRFLKSENPIFFTWIDRIKLNEYIEMNPLKIDIK